MMNFAAVVGDLLAFAHAIVSNHARNPQAVIGEKSPTSFRLRDAVFICGAARPAPRPHPEKMKATNRAWLVETS